MILCFACYSQMKEDRAEFACMALLRLVGTCAALLLADASRQREFSGCEFRPDQLERDTILFVKHQCEHI